MKCTEGVGMKKNKVLGSVLLLGLALCTGCGSKLPEMTEEQENQIVEYAAAIVMNHVKDDGSRLVDLSLYEEKPQPEPEATKEPEAGKMDETADTTIIDNAGEEKVNAAGSLDELLVPEGITITYNGYKVVESYPEADDANPYFTLDAATGKKLLVLQFTMQNETAEEKELDIFSQEPKSTVVINGKETKNILSTMLLDDLSTYEGSLAGGEALDLVLLAEIDETMSETFESLSLRMKIETGSVTTTLK